MNNYHNLSSILMSWIVDPLIVLCFFFSAYIFSSMPPSVAYAEDVQRMSVPIQKITFGFVEKVIIGKKGVVISAKLDSGADSSSLHADTVSEFKKNGKHWVRFSLSDRLGVVQTFERPVIRTVKIKRHLRPAQKRLVVRLPVCLGSSYAQADVSLIDRSKFEYPMLLGRQYLAGMAIIDPSATFTAEPICDLGVPN